MKKVTTRGLAKAIEEHLDSLASLTKEAYGVSVYPVTINRARRSKEKLDQMLKQVNMEAKDGISRRHPKA